MAALPLPLVEAGVRCSTLLVRDGLGHDGPYMALVTEVAAISPPVLPTSLLPSLLSFGASLLLDLTAVYFDSASSLPRSGSAVALAKVLHCAPHTSLAVLDFATHVGAHLHRSLHFPLGALSSPLACALLHQEVFDALSERDRSAIVRLVESMMVEHNAVFAGVVYAEKGAVNRPEHLGALQTSPLSALNDTSEGINILSIDGGGMRGLFALACLCSITEALYGDSDHAGTHKLMSNIDLVCGTSTGGIIATGLATGRSLQELRGMYLSMGGTVFGSRWFYGPGRLLRYYRSGDYYSGTLLADLFHVHLGSASLSAVQKKVTPTLWHACLVRAPYLLRSYGTHSSTFSGTSEIALTTALRATSAAPTYFSNVTVNDRILVDGGCMANNPTELAVFEAHHLWPGRPIRSILSIGTGVPGPSPGSVNIFRLVHEFINIATNSDLTHQRVLEWLSLESSGSKYFRFSPTDKLGSIPLDCSDMSVLLDGENRTRRYMEEEGQKGMLGDLQQLFNPS